MQYRQAAHPTFWVCKEGCRSGCGADLTSYSHCYQGDSNGSSNGSSNGTDCNFRSGALETIHLFLPLGCALCELTMKCDLHTPTV